MNERILELRKILGLTQLEFAKKIGIARSTLAGIELNKAEITERTILVIVSVFGVNIEWIKQGKGEIFNVSSNYQKFIEIYKSLNPIFQEFLTNTAISLLDVQDKL